MSWYNHGLSHALSRVTRFVHHPPGWFAAAFPLMTMENQRYWAQKLGGATGAHIYDAATRQVVQKALGPQGPALLDAYNKVTEDAIAGHLDAKDVIAHAPQIAKIALASKRGPAALQQVLHATGTKVGQEDVTVIGSVGDDLKTGGKLALVFAGIFGAIFLVAGTGSAKKTAYDNHPAYRRLK